jgi:hypothetical protein
MAELVERRIVVMVFDRFKSARRFQNKFHAFVLLHVLEHRFDVRDDFTFAAALCELLRLFDKVWIAISSREADGGLRVAILRKKLKLPFVQVETGEV